MTIKRTESLTLHGRRVAAMAAVIAVAALLLVKTAFGDVMPHVYPYVGYSSHNVGPSGRAVCNTTGYDWSHSEGLSFYGYSGLNEVQVTQLSQANGWETSAQSFTWGATWLVDGWDSNNTASYIEPAGYSFTTGLVFYPSKDLNYDNSPLYTPYIVAQWGLFTGGCNKSSTVIIHGPN